MAELHAQFAEDFIPQLRQRSCGIVIVLARVAKKPNNLVKIGQTGHHVAPAKEWALESHAISQNAAARQPNQ
ncbi:MAG: hypothetical protein ACLQIQ_17575 [Beijerinckiaceae bacterium]